MTNETMTAEDAVETEAPPTLDEVRREESKTAELRARVDEIGPEIEAYEAEVAEALADGDEESARRLRASRRELIELRADLQAAVEVLDARAASRREKATKAMAERRLEAIEDEVVVGASLLDEDLARLIEAAHVVAEVSTEIEERYTGLVRSEAESRKLCERFPDLDSPELPTVLPPGKSEAARAALKLLRDIRVAVRPPKRVSIDGTPTAEIISSAGEERPLFTLSPEELAERKEAEKRARMLAERKAAEEARVEAELSRFGAGTGSRTG